MNNWHTLYDSLCVEVRHAHARLIFISICLVCLIPAHGTGYSYRNLYPLHAYGRKMLKGVGKLQAISVDVSILLN